MAREYSMYGCDPRDMADLHLQLSEKLGLPNDIFVSLVGTDNAIMRLEQLGAKAKVQVWSLSSLGGASPTPGGDTGGDVGDGGGREIMLMILQSDLIPSARKLKCTAKDLSDLLAQASENFDLPKEVYMTSAGSTEPLHSLDQLASKAKVQIHLQQAAAAQQPVGREMVMMILPNELVPTSRKFKCQVADLTDLVAQASAKLGLPTEIVFSPAVSGGAAPVPYQSLEEVEAKAKVQIWPLSASSPSADQATASPSSSVAGAGRDILLMVLPSTAVGSSKKLKLSGVQDLSDLITKAAQNLGLGLHANKEFFIAHANSDGNATTPDAPLTKLDQLGPKAKVQFWPIAGTRRMFHRRSLLSYTVVGLA